MEMNAGKWRLVNGDCILLECSKVLSLFCSGAVPDSSVEGSSYEMISNAYEFGNR